LPYFARRFGGQASHKLQVERGLMNRALLLFEAAGHFLQIINGSVDQMSVLGFQPEVPVRIASLRSR